MSDPSTPGSDPQATTGARAPVASLVLGALAGVALAAWGLLSTDPAVAGLPDDAVARVNGTLLPREDHARLVAGLESDLRQEITPALRRRVLDRMIDEELLVQRGVELGLVESDRRVRGDITSAMIRSIVVEAEDREPTDEELEAFHAEEKGFFAQPGRLRVRQVFIRVRGGDDEAEAIARAEAARAALLDGEAIAEVRARMGDSEVSPVPDALLPPAKLREYVGPTALRAVAELEVGQVGAPVRSGTGVHVFQLVDAEEARTPSFGEIRDQVRGEWVRRAGDRALREYLDDLRDRAEVEVDDAFADAADPAT